MSMTKPLFSQIEILDFLLPILKSDGRLYQKVKNVHARPAVAGERVKTITSDGSETFNVAEEGDFVIQNQTMAKEQYIISGEKFKARYVFSEGTTSEYDIYKAIGKVIAIELTNDFLVEQKLPEQFYFTAPWEESMVAKKGDFLVSLPDFSQIYRIARNEFFETYQEI